jgi:hypothetical protein
MFGRLKPTLGAEAPTARVRRRSRRAAVEVAPLESRSLLSTVTITEAVSPKVLWPPNGREVPVTVSGMITDTGAPLSSVGLQYNVQDSETGTTSPNMTPQIQLTQSGMYSFTVELQARRSGHDRPGRIYTINVFASDMTGGSDMAFAKVIVPHDQGHRFFFGGNGGGNSGDNGGSSGTNDLGRRFGSRSSGAFGASNSVHLGGSGQGQTNSVTVPGSNNTVTTNITNNTTYNINNSFNTTVTAPSTPSSPAPTGGDHGNGGDQGDEGDSGDQGGGSDHGNGNGHGNGNDNGNGNGNGNNKQGGD